MDNDSSLDAARQSINKFVILLHLINTIVSPVVLEVLVDLPVQTVRQWFILPEPSQQRHPIMKLKCLLLDTHIAIESRNDLDET